MNKRTYTSVYLIHVTDNFCCVVLPNRCTADCRMVDQCELFIKKHALLLDRLQLRRNLMLHFINMVDFGVLKAAFLPELFT